MSFSLKQCKLNFLHLRNPDLQQAFKQGIAAFQYTDLAATAVACHAAVQESAALAFPGPFTDPACPRSLSVAFAGGWTGGNITVVGYDQFGRAQTETITASAGSTVQGVKIWRTISSAAHTAIAGTSDTATLQTGTLIGLPVPLLGAWGIGLVNGVAELFTWDATYYGWTPGTNAPNGSRDYTIIVPVNWDLYKRIVVAEQPDL